jgi:hypothetical protein
MTMCQYCGGNIEFRYVGGVCTPIHVDGNRCTGWSSSVGGTASKREVYDFEDICYTTDCPECGAEVYFIRHNGGSVWVDPPLGWPWPKHPCMDKRKSTKPGWLKEFEQKVNSTSEDLMVGIVTRSKPIRGVTIEEREIALAIDFGEKRRIIISTEGTTTSDFLRGEIVVVDFSLNRILFSNSQNKQLLRKNLNPTIFGLPEDWSTLEK